jgi:prepilin peptidase CpaA
MFSEYLGSVQSIAWWSNLVVLVAASAIDVRTRRIPNWLVLPFLVLGVVVQSAVGGLSGAAHSLAGAGVAVLLFLPLWFLKAMGLGDLKLATGVGAWIGPSQFFLAFIVTGMVGGVMAACYAVWHRSLGRSLDHTGEVLACLAKGRFRHLRERPAGNSKELSIPYAPAIAIGTLFSFFAR